MTTSPQAAPGSAPASAQVPEHVGIILDGNRRWARAHGLATAGHGHRAGFGKIPEVLSWCEELGIRFVTVWMLSDDNVAHRSAAELQDLYTIDAEVVNKLASDGRWRLRAIGRTELLPGTLAELLHTAERATCGNGGMSVNLALAYGGRSDLLHAVRALADALRAGRITEVTEEHVSGQLSTAGQPDPDLIIRTSGELRTSGFLLWQAALAELYFCPRLWPDFTREDLTDAVRAYASRQRRLGA
ncbi:polyprenyl diphosphate synthase [Longispora albida]|uniref:polyprenyl diphosphate synthase n=1 Tax=Longispora albida TaxID=203523 RepID=UPI000A01EC21|nr:polyprenyl diphosphate synthase [Longispora albida]